MGATEPEADAFFATATGVCVYVNVGARTVRVQFESLSAPATSEESGDADVNEALLVASTAFEKHKPLLEALFEQVSVELASRRGDEDSDP
jgi:hypothetical protein